MRRTLNFVWFHPLLIAIFVAPIWTIPVYLTQDGPAHAYDAKLLKEWSDPASALTRQYWTPDWMHTGDWACQILMAGLQTVVSPQAAEKAVITLCTILLTAGLAFLSRRVHGRFHPAELLGYLLAYSYVPMIGLYNYLIGLGAAFFVIGWWWVHRDRMGAGRWTLFAAAALIIYVIHLVAWLFLISAVAVHALLDTIGPSGTAKKRIAAVLFALLGLFAVVVYGYVENISIDIIKFRPMTHWLWYFSKAKYLDTFRESGIRGLLFNMWLIATLFYSVHSYGVNQKDPKKRSLLLVLATLWTAAYFFAPWAYFRDPRHYGSMINERITLLVVVLWVMSADLREKSWAILSTGFLAGMIVWQSFAALSEMNGLQPQIREFLSGTKMLAPHSAFKFEVEGLIDLDTVPHEYSDLEVMGKLPFRYGLVQKDLILTGMTGHDVDAIWPHHFEMNVTGLPDRYIVAWRSSKEDEQFESSGYQKIFEEKRLRVFEKVQMLEDTILK